VRLAITQYPAVIFALGMLAVRKSARPERWVAAALVIAALAYLAGLFRY